MTPRRVSAAVAKFHFAALLAEVAHGGMPVIVERNGKPYVAIVDINDLARIEKLRVTKRPAGALALVGGWRDVGDARIDALVTELYEHRAGDVPRTVDLVE